MAAVPAYSPKLWVDSHRTIHNTLFADHHTSGISGHQLAEEEYVLLLFPVLQFVYMQFLITNVIICRILGKVNTKLLTYDVKA